MRHCADGEIDALHVFDPSDHEHVVTVRSLTQTVRERRRMIQAFGGHAVEGPQPPRGVIRIREHMPALAEHARVELEQLAAKSDISLGVLEVAVGCAAQLVGGAMLMDHPRHLAGMAREVGRKARGDQEIDWLAVARREIEEAPRGGLREQVLFRLRSKRQRDEVDFVAAMSQHVDERSDVQLGAAGDKRHVSVGDEDPADLSQCKIQKSKCTEADPIRILHFA